MNDRVRSGIIYASILILILGLSIWFNWTPVVLALAVAFLGSLEVGSALARKFRPLSIGWIFAGSLVHLSPLIVAWLYRDLRNWYIIMDPSSLGDLWRTDFLWYLGLSTMTVFFAYLLFAFTKVAIQVIRKGPAILPHSVAELGASFYLAIPLSIIVMFTFAVPDGFKWLLLAIIMPSITDVSAYYVGNAFGKRHILPKISPNKTLAGFLGGLFAPMLIVGFLFMIFFRGVEPQRTGYLITFVWGAVTGLLLSLASQVGDWIASALKRYCGVKDFSHLLPGHGGILDRFDSVLYCLPMALLLAVAFKLL